MIHLRLAILAIALFLGACELLSGEAFHDWRPGIGDAR